MASNVLLFFAPPHIYIYIYIYKYRVALPCPGYLTGGGGGPPLGGYPIYMIYIYIYIYIYEEGQKIGGYYWPFNFLIC